VLDFLDRIESLSQNDGVYAWQPRIVNARHFKRIDWTQESILLVTMSTAGDGEMTFIRQLYVGNVSHFSHEMM